MLWVVVSVLVLLLTFVFSLQFKPVQTFVAQKATDYLSKELKTTVKVGGLYIKPFKSVVLEDLLVLDLQHDTLAKFPKFMVDLNRFSVKERILDINIVQINDGKFFLKDLPNGASNLDFIIDYFDSPAPKTKKKKKKFQFLLGQIILNNFDFKYKNLKYHDTVAGVNFDDIAVSQLNGIFEKFDTKDHLIQTNIKNLSFKEKSGFILKNLSAHTTIDTNQIELKNLLLQTNRTKLTDYYQMRFEHFRDFKDYVNKVRMKAHFKDSHIESSDIAFFAPELNKIKLSLDVEGNISGYVSNLKAKKLSVKAGKATYIKGDVSMNGLPNWDETFIEAKVEMAGTNKQDLDDILTDITGKKVKSIPDIVTKFGNINFNGSFTGFQNDFIAYGEFKTKLGRVKSDVNMKIDRKGVPSYSGSVKTYDFNLGELTNEKSLGRVTSDLYVKGRGTEVKTLKEELKGTITYIDFNQYRYNNVKINGTFDKRFFNGDLSINDKNVQLDFKGGVNLNPKLPVFNFDADIKNAKLHTLKLYKDSLKLNASFKANFSGNNLNNIEGDFMVSKITLQNKKGIYNVDSLELTAQGVGAGRTLTVSSDILDASIKGQYDLNTIAAYYQAIAKTYVPSLGIKKPKYNTQIFDFNLKIKDFDPISDLVAPGLDIEDQAVLIGNFDSRNNTAALTGSIKKLTYKGIVVSNIILDESTTSNQLQATLSSDRVDLNDSLYIKNVNINNILRRDSLMLNVKLSNADDANKLDLNGLVEFAADTTAKISILPSDVTVNNEEWLIEDKVRISFNKGKTEVTNFELANHQQKIKIDGFISESPEDVLKVGFENFSLKTINPFVKTLGVKLGGMANGKAMLNAILKRPVVKDSLRIDSLSFNNTFIGALTDTSSFNSNTKAVNVFTKIIANGKETFNITGGLDLEEKNIDLAVKMDDCQMAVLEPFVKKLVSNLKGFISSDLTIKGPLDKPQIDGSVTLDEAGLTVNYLKTPYTIDDRIEINNGKIDLDDLELMDMDGNTARANGSVDLTNLDNPDIQVEIRARNFMALNTTAKDNQLYYGRAYATGKFTFEGPTNNMDIDIDARTEAGTVFNLPLNNSETVSDKDFITFVSKDTTQVIKKPTSFEGLTMHFKLKVDPASVANIYTVLGKLSGKGNAELELNITSAGDFEMKGDYIIESGNFDFTAQEVINKRFDIRQGGTIRWTGNPTNAQINLKAIYALRASLIDLYTAANRDGSSNAQERVQVEVEMGLSGLLMKPDIKLDIFFPANPAVKEELQAYFNDGNNLNTQALSLIIQRSFAPGTGKDNIGQQLSSVGTNTATELIFNQFNNLLSSLNLNFVDINIRSFNEASASFKLFNNRVIVNAGIVDNTKASTDYTIGLFRNNVGREVEVLGLIRKDGTLIGKLANKPQTQQSVFVNPGVDPTANITSVGLIYTQQFDSFTEFMKRITGKYKKEQERKRAERGQRLNKEAIMIESKKNPKKK